MEELKEMLEDFYYDHQRGLMATLIIIVGIIAAYITYITLYNPIKIKFVGEDTEIVATSTTKLDYGAIAYDKNRQDYPIIWEVTGGILNQNEGAEVEWDLPNEPGSYTITATSGETKSSKTVTVLENVLVDTLQVVDVASVDDDMDGLTNEYEQNISLTDSQNKDSDGDTINDGDEIVLGLNPKLVDTKGDSIEDSKRKLTYEVVDKDTNTTITISGSGNLTKTTVDTYETESLKNINSIISPVYYISSEASIDKMNITLKYDKARVQSKNANEDALSVYKIDEQTNRFTKLVSNINKDTSSISTEITENAKVFIADSNTMVTGISTEIMFVIDNSGSMYSKDEIAESSENDVDFERLSTAKKMIDKLKGDYKFGAGKFTFEYTELASMTSDKEFVKNKIESVKTMTEKFSGTYIGEALSGGLQQFTNSNTNGARRYLILLTDGKDTEDVEGYDRDKTKNAIEEAKRKGVKVYTIGLGQEIDQEALANIAAQTSGKYYYAVNADVLNSLFEIIASQINYSLVDVDGNHEDDSIIVSDSGFVTKRNGFSFDNIPLANNLEGFTYGMSLLSKLYYENTLPKSLSTMSVKIPGGTEVVKAEGFSSSDMGLNGALYENKIEGIEVLSDRPKDFRSGGVIDSVLRIKTDYSTLLQQVGFKIYEQDYTHSKAAFDKYQIYVLDTESELYNGSMSSVGKAYMNAIARLDILKYRDETLSFSNSPEQCMKYLENSMDNSKVCMLKLNDTYTVNALRIILDKSNPNNFKIEVYDPNVAGVEKYIECTRNKVYNFENNDKTPKKVSENYVYSFTYGGKEVDIKISIPNVQDKV